MRVAGATFRRRALYSLLCLLIAGTPAFAASDLSPAAVGWGNLFVPGMGATLRDQPVRGLLEAGTEIGLFFGGTFGVREGSFTIDTTILLPQRDNLYRPLLGLSMQEIGLKVHMFNTFFHYQQASLSVAESEGEKARNELQPLYTGDWTDVLAAPFRWKHLSSPWVFGMLIPIAAYLIADYASSTPAPYRYHPSGTENALYGAYDIALEPLGSAFGEEPAFRGFLQRELSSYTGSVYLSILMQSVLFTALHPGENRVPAFFGGLYFGFLTHHFHGDIEKAVAAHFWVNVINGTLAFLNFRRSQNQGSLQSSGPPLGLTLAIPL